MNVQQIIENAGGIATTQGLKRAGASDRQLTDAVASGRIRRVKRGWYSTRGPHDPEVRAIAAGGRLTGLSAIQSMGGWVWSKPKRLHVAVPPNASRFARSPSIAVHWVVPSVPPQSATVVGLFDALTRVALDADLETAVAAFDWAFRSGRLDRFDFEQILLLLPIAARRIARFVDPASQSILESVARVRALLRGWRVRSQVGVGDLQSIDLVIEGQVALELDGRQFHEATFESDRRKDLSITIEGRHSLRVSKPMLVDEWQRVVAAVEAALRARGIAFARFSGVKPVATPPRRRTRPLPRLQT